MFQNPTAPLAPMTPDAVLSAFRSCPTTTVSDGGLFEAPRGCASSGSVLAWLNRALPQQTV
ncbi:hypothetical protein [Streptomyces sp. MMBL 11-3]|uniref:hypothetical protein n=1 Tax=Streptomyces sp. MMBL 11-3 TaxID=3382639 RepID=UPI0039B37CA3